MACFNRSWIHSVATLPAHFSISASIPCKSTAFQFVSFFNPSSMSSWENTELGWFGSDGGGICCAILSAYSFWQWLIIASRDTSSASLWFFRLISSQNPPAFSAFFLINFLVRCTSNWRFFLHKVLVMSFFLSSLPALRQPTGHPAPLQGTRHTGGASHLTWAATSL